MSNCLPHRRSPDITEQLQMNWDPKSMPKNAQEVKVWRTTLRFI